MEFQEEKKEKKSKLYSFGNLLGRPSHFVTFEENDWKEKKGAVMISCPLREFLNNENS